MQRQTSGSVPFLSDDELSQSSAIHPFICNIVPSPLDVRDWPAECIVHGDLKIPPKFQIRYALPPIENQGNEYNLSAAYAATAIKQWQEYHNVGIIGSMSAFFLYNNRFHPEKTSMCGREIMHILKRHGCCTVQTYPVQDAEPIQEIDHFVYEEANNYRICAYARVYTIERLKLALLKNGPCLITLPVFHYGIEPWNPKCTGRQIGGTAMVVVGYDTQGFHLRNSWGKEWGDHGYTVYKYKDWGIHFEIWTLLDDMNSTAFDSSAPKKKNISRWIWKRAMEFQRNAGDLFSRKLQSTSHENYIHGKSITDNDSTVLDEEKELEVEDGIDNASTTAIENS